MYRGIPSWLSLGGDEVSGAVFVRDFASGLVLFERPAMARKENRALYTAEPMAQA